MAAINIFRWAARCVDWIIAQVERGLLALSKHLWVTYPQRAWIEAGVVMILLLLLVLTPMKNAPSVVIPATLLLFTLVCGSIMGLRMRLLPGPWKTTLLREALLTIPLTILLILICVSVLWIGGGFWLLDTSPIHPSGTLLVIGMCVPACLTLRAAVRLWRWWDALRQRRFLWALTHAQLTVVVLLGVLLMLLGLTLIGTILQTELNDLSSLPGSPPYSMLMQVIIWLLGLAFLTLVFIGAGILILFPAALIFAYLVGRGLTHRVETLAQAASHLRAGNLSARVLVEGKDELAELQNSFNQMATDLEQRTSELQTERDCTTAVLNSHRELTAAVSHELRTPLATARTYLDALLEPHLQAADPEQVQHDLRILSGEMERLEHLIDDLFTLSRAEVDRLSLNIQPVAVEPLLQRLVEMIEKPAWDQHRVEVTVKASTPEPLMAYADPSRLEQVIRNLLQNSLRHTLPGGFVLVSAEAAGEWVRISVEDSGEGIDLADLPHIWERFYRSESSRMGGEGSGLGLALVREITESMGGQVGVDSAPGQGSTFWCSLPACD